jgi:histidinol-phosphate aminotransferase
MSKYDKVVPEHVRALGGYVPGKPIKQAEKESGITCIKMASNENPFGPSPRALEAMRRAAAEVNLYPDNEVTDLRQRLAERHQVDPSMVLVTAGSTSFLTVIGRTLLAPGLDAIIGEQSFIIYPLVIKSAAGRIISVPMCDNGYDLDAVLARIDADTRVVFIANPNNPTGTLLAPAEVDRFMERVPPYVCVVLDEAYSDFAEYFAAQRGVEYSRSLNYVREGRNVVVLRTFSKAHGLAGARIGYGIAPRELIEFFARMKTVFSVTAIAEAGALAALEDEKHIRLSLENNAAGAQWLTERLTDMGLRVVPTWANFLFIDVNEDAALVAKRLQGEGIIVRPLTGNWGAPQAIRVTVGTPEQNEKFLRALKAVMERAAVP